MARAKTRIKIKSKDNKNSTTSFMGKEKGHVTRDCPDAKETQERIKIRANPQPPPQQPAREVNHTFALP
jgi:hypothetical protein